jgi:hypothetical protein
MLQISPTPEFDSFVITLTENGFAIWTECHSLYENRRENPVALCAGMRGEAGDGVQYPARLPTICRNND